MPNNSTLSSNMKKGDVLFVKQEVSDYKILMIKKLCMLVLTI